MTDPDDTNIANLKNLISIRSENDPAVLADREPSSLEIHDYLKEENVGKFIAYRNNKTGYDKNNSSTNPPNIYNLLRIGKTPEGIFTTNKSEQLAQIDEITGFGLSVHKYTPPQTDSSSTPGGGRSRQRKTLARKNRKSRSRKNRKSRSRKNRK